MENYTKTTWVDGDVISSQKLNNIENGLDAVSQEATNLRTDLTDKLDAPSTAGTSGQVLTSDGEGGQYWHTPSGGGGGTSDYDDLTDKPSINSVTLSGNKTTSDLGIHDIPSGGSSGQVLAKASATDYDLTWVNPSGGGGSYDKQIEISEYRDWYLKTKGEEHLIETPGSYDLMWDKYPDVRLGISSGGYFNQATYGYGFYFPVDYNKGTSIRIDRKVRSSRFRLIAVSSEPTLNGSLDYSRLMQSDDVGSLVYNLQSTDKWLYCLYFNTTSDTTITREEVIAGMRACYGSTFTEPVYRLDEVEADIISLDERLDLVGGTNNAPKGVFGIMQYNCGGWYNGSGDPVPSDKYDNFLALQKSIIDRYAPDVLCIEEYHSTFSTGHNTLDVLLDDRYANIVTAKGNTTYGGKAICTNRTLTDASNTEYSVHATEQMHQNYEKAYIYCNGRKVCFIATHIAQTTARAQQCTELLAAVANEEYVVICMDANIDAQHPESSDWASSIGLFSSAGYTIVNDGDYVTYPSGHSGAGTALDNIIVSDNITVRSCVMDTQKYGLTEGADHYPLMLYCEIY